MGKPRPAARMHILETCLYRRLGGEIDRVLNWIMQYNNSPELKSASQRWPSIPLAGQDSDSVSCDSSHHFSVNFAVKETTMLQVGYRTGAPGDWAPSITSPEPVGMRMSCRRPLSQAARTPTIGTRADSSVLVRHCRGWKSGSISGRRFRRLTKKGAHAPAGPWRAARTGAGIPHAHLLADGRINLLEQV
jgi:hypothetical protein